MLTKRQIQSCIIWACTQEVSAPKPGNVNCFSGGHNMQIEDFLLSAEAIAGPLTESSFSIGQRIYAAIQATRQVVGSNTNLGIVLLFAPLCKAIEDCDNFSMLTMALEGVLNDLTVDDAIACYQAIALAEAGGLGAISEQDISATPTVTLKQAMAIAKNSDSIAKQYVNNYKEIREIGFTRLTIAINCGKTVEWATALAYLTILAAVPDTLICRKQNMEQAMAVSKKAETLIKKMSKFNTLSSLESQIIAWDNELKRQAINPGTTADMTAASLLIYQFQCMLDPKRISVP